MKIKIYDDKFVSKEYKFSLCLFSLQIHFLFLFLQNDKRKPEIGKTIKKGTNLKN